MCQQRNFGVQAETFVHSTFGWSGTGGRGAGMERGTGVTDIGWSAKRVFHHSHDLDACYSVLCLRCRIFDIWHVGCIVRLVFVAVH